MPVQLEEIYRRADQGVLRPFLCRAEDGATYFVKGKGAGIRGLVAEFIGGRLAQILGLPVAEFQIVEAPAQLVDACLLEDASELGPGVGFASRQVEAVQEISRSTQSKVPEDLQARVLAFDWWIRNEDRHFGGSGGNPNLLWDMQKQRLVVIDHHAAFDPSFDSSAFWEGHIFRAVKASFGDPAFQREQVAGFERALGEWEGIAAGLPDEWLDYMADFCEDFDIGAIRRILERCRDGDFWRIP